jgi:hypothetical protein
VQGSFRCLGVLLSKANKPSKGSAAKAAYEGRERRRSASTRPKPHGKIRFDAKGNPVWEPQIDTPRRRDGDNTIDLLKCLDVDGLKLADDTPEDDPGYDPYRRSR